MSKISNKKIKDIKEINSWLVDNLIKVELDISNSKCKKWNKWLEDKSTHIYPCVCNSREQDCIFIETYYELENLINLHKKEDYFKGLISEYKQIENDKKEIKKWIKKYEDVGNSLFFKCIIEIKLESEPLKYLKLQFNKNEFQNLIEFQKLFDETYYTEEFQNSTNL